MNLELHTKSIAWRGHDWILDFRRVIIHPDSKHLILSDIHLGIYTSFRVQGSYLPAYDQDILQSTLEDLSSVYPNYTWIIAGDIKHSKEQYDSLEQLEIEEIVNFLNFIVKKSKKLILLLGNHDKGLGEIVLKEKIDCEVVSEYVLNDIVITHKLEDFLEHSTHRKNEVGTIVGHVHPVIRLEQMRGYTIPVFVVSPNYIILPAFNSVTGGFMVTKLNEREQMKLYGTFKDKLYEFT